MDNTSNGIYLNDNECHYLLTNKEKIDITDFINTQNLKKQLNILHGDNVNINFSSNEVIVVKPTDELICGILHINSNVSHGSTNSGAIKKKFTPANKNLPEFLVSTKKPFQVFDIYVTIKFEKWTKDSCHPTGTIVRYIGDIGDQTAEREYIKQISTSKWSNLRNLNIDEYLQDITPNRTDLTNKCIISIDPPSCKDIDDALHIEQNDTGYEIGIHIADVSSYIPNNSSLDKELLKRAESVYLATEQINMIPDKLSLLHCSLIENKKARAFSIIINIDNDGNILSTSMCKSSIMIHKNLDYDYAQKIINSKKSSNITTVLTNLYNIAKKIKLFQHLIDDQSYDTHKMVEIYMVLANHIVAKTIYNVYKAKSLLRKHIGIKFSDIKYSNDIPKFITDKVIIQQYNSAEYCFGTSDENNNVHAGLGNILYTHFTSPIRRYADIIVHRMLFETLDKNDIDLIHFDIIENLNYVHKKNNKLEKDSYIIEKIYNLPSVNEFSAFIIGISNNKLRFYIPEIDLNVTSNIYPNKLKHLYKMTYDNTSIEIQSIQDQHISFYKLFQKINLKLIITLRDKNKLNITF